MMKANPSPKFRIVGTINDETLVLGMPYKHFKEKILEEFLKQIPHREQDDDLKKSDGK